MPRRSTRSDRESALDALSVARKWLWLSAERLDRIDQAGAVADLQSMGDHIASLIEDVMKTPRRTRPPITRQLAANGQRHPESC